MRNGKNMMNTELIYKEAVIAAHNLRRAGVRNDEIRLYFGTSIYYFLQQEFERTVMAISRDANDGTDYFAGLPVFVVTDPYFIGAGIGKRIIIAKKGDSDVETK